MNAEAEAEIAPMASDIELPAVKLDYAIKFFGGRQKLAEALGVSQGAITYWKQHGGVLPPLRSLTMMKIIERGASK